MYMYLYTSVFYMMKNVMIQVNLQILLVLFPLIIHIFYDRVVIAVSLQTL